MDITPSQTKKRLIILAVGLVGMFMLFWLTQLITRQGETKLDIYTIPGDAIVSINTAKARTGANYLSPGEYTVEVAKDGYRSSERTVKLENQGIREEFALTPVSDEAKEWARENQTLYLDFEKRSGEKTRVEGEAISTANPLINFLPYRSLYFNIDYKREGAGVVILVSANTPTGRRFAIEQIKKWGFTPSSYDIKFVDLINPFTGAAS